ncbi:spore germination protein [Halalkalibacterium halodurans]|nr:spore germination protein [Halalkalibacterium halodurans]
MPKPITKTEYLEQVLEKGLLTTEEVKQFFHDYSDVYFVQASDQDHSLISFYCKGMVDVTRVNEYYYAFVEEMEAENYKCKEYIPPSIQIKTVASLIEKTFSGYLIFYQKGNSFFYGIDVAKVPQREPAESRTEVSIKGPKDAFTEELNLNISLIRKRLKTEYLFSEAFTLGSISQTKVALLYLDNKINPKMLHEVRSRLERFDSESITSGGQLEQWLSDRTFCLFPLFDYIMRPDFAIECMLRGRFILVVDGSPTVLIGPINLFELIKSPEDTHFPYFFVAFQRVLRLISLSVAIFLPGFWLAISSVNLDQLPLPLLSTAAVARDGLPFPSVVEALFILGLFELLREAGLRMPSALGPTISIVGGLIIGDAAIRAGLASPALIVIIALTAVATFTLVNQSLTSTVSVLRIYTLVLSSFLGIYGFFISMFSILIYLSRLSSFHIDYLDPIASLSYKDFLAALLVNPFKRKKFNSSMLKKGDNNL